MPTTINVTRNAQQVRLSIGEPTAEGDNVTTNRHWDLPIVHALMLAAALTGEVVALLQEHMKANAQPAPEPERRDTIPAPPPNALQAMNGAGKVKHTRESRVGKRPQTAAK